MLKNKQCAVCKGHYDPSMLVGIMDTYICDVCVSEMDNMMKEELGNDYKIDLPKTSSRQIENGIPVFRVVSPIHPKNELEPTTA
jgi:hypothetical protein